MRKVIVLVAGAVTTEGLVLELPLGANVEGHKKVLRTWSSKNEDSRFWLGVAIELITAVGPT
jgi:transposase-like protein